MANYITLSNSNDSVTKRFKAIAMAHTDHKAQDVRETAGGDLDISVGGLHHSIKYSIRVPNEVVDDIWGTRSDLLYFYALNNPSATPSNLLKLTDHYGVTHDVIFVGDVTPEPLTTIITGTEASYIIQSEFRVIT
jgi:hypothetical protein